jgi:hypothetical protein
MQLYEDLQRRIRGREVFENAGHALFVDEHEGMERDISWIVLDFAGPQRFSFTFFASGTTILIEFKDFSYEREGCEGTRYI